MATPIFDNGIYYGVIAAQISSDQISNMTNYGKRWEATGLGKTGEIFIVGSDQYLRTHVRPYLEDKEKFFESVRQNGVDAESIDKMRRFGTPVILQPARSDSIDAAIRGERSIRLIESDYEGREAISASVPLDIGGLDWMLVAEMPTEEALAPIRDFQRRIVLTVAMLSIGVTMLSLLLSRLFTLPIQRLTERVEEVVAGDLNTTMTLKRNDEYGELADSLQDLVDSLRARTEAADAERDENEGMLLKFLPEGIVRTIKSRPNGEDKYDIAEVVPNASYIYAEISGYEDFVSALDPDTAVEQIDRLIEMMDLAAERNGIEKVRTVGSVYFAVAGLSATHLDHDRRAANFALELVAIITRYRKETGEDINITVGISTGKALSGVVGKNRLAFDLWGEPILECEQPNDLAADSEILISKALAQRLGSDYDFVKPIPKASHYRLKHRKSTPEGEA